MVHFVSYDLKSVNHFHGDKNFKQNNNRNMAIKRIGKHIKFNFLISSLKHVISKMGEKKFPFKTWGIQTAFT